MSDDSNGSLSDSDHQALTQLVVEWAWRLDHGQAHTLYELCTEDVSVQLDKVSMQGRAGVKAWFEENALAGPVRHVCTNMRFVRVDDERAEGSCLVTVYRHDPPGTPDIRPYVVGEYLDEFVRQDGQWKIASCRGVPAFRRSAQEDAT